MAAHQEGSAVTSIRFQPEKLLRLEKRVSDDELSLPVQSPVPWCADAYYLAQRPSFTFDPLFHAGVYYVQEASSMFLWEALKQTVGSETRGKRVLDLCAAPGGKSTLLSSYFFDGVVVSNEVIKSRANILVENITKWGLGNVVVTNNDPLQFQKLESMFDVMVVDAPCSGSGLFRKDPEAIGEWSEEAVALCSQRQHRILADAYPCLKQNGILLYSTCSYSEAEDEDVLDWLMDQYQLLPVPLHISGEWGIVESYSPKHKANGYRFYPDRVKGEGFFFAAFIKQEEHSAAFLSSFSLSFLNKKEREPWLSWLRTGEDLSFIKQKETVIALPPAIANALPLLQKALYLKSAGVALGEIKGKDVVPHQALALSSLASLSLPRISFTRAQAIQYLQRKEITIDVTALPKGWGVASYCGIPLGWLKVLPNRINNYYPTEWRILKN